MKRFFLFFLANAYFLQAQQYANEFLNIGVDAVSKAMAGSVSAGTDNVFSAYWNPAGLTGVQNTSIALMHASYFKNLAQYDFVSFAKPRDEKSVIAASLVRFGVDRIMNTTQLIDNNGYVDYNRITYFSAADYALIFSYGTRQLAENFSAGVNLKLIYRHIGDFAQAYGFGMDLGVQYTWKEWKTGMILRDATTTYSYWKFNEDRLAEIQNAVSGQNQTAPDKHEISYPKLQWGIGRKFRIKKDYGLLVEMDFHTYFAERKTLVQSKYFSMEPSLGLEGNYKQKIFLRMGIRDLYGKEVFGQKVWNIAPSAGLGFRFKHLQFDYAFLGFQDQGLQSHVFSLILDLNIFKKNNEN